LNVLLYDDDCGFCSRQIQFILRHEKHHTLLFSGLGSPYARHLLRHHAEFNEVDSVLWVDLVDSATPRRVLAKSAAALRLCTYLGGGWQWLRIAWIVPRPVRDAAYDIIARNRHRLVGDSVCALPTPAENSRFVNDAPGKGRDIPMGS